MEMLNWIDKKYNEIKNDDLFKKYFDAIPVENGIESYNIINKKLGIDIILTERFNVMALHFFSDKTNGIKPFKDMLPFNLNFSLSQKNTRNLLGVPEKSGGGDFSFLYGISPTWDRYQFDKFYLHLQFTTAKDKIEMVTIDSILNK